MKNRARKKVGDRKGVNISEKDKKGASRSEEGNRLWGKGWDIIERKAKRESRQKSKPKREEQVNGEEGKKKDQTDV